MSELQQCYNPKCGAYFDGSGSPYCRPYCEIQSLEATIAAQAKEIERLTARSPLFADETYDRNMRDLTAILKERDEEIERLRQTCETTKAFIEWCAKDRTYAPLMHRFRQYAAAIQGATIT